MGGLGARRISAPKRGHFYGWDVVGGRWGQYSLDQLEMSNTGLNGFSQGLGIQKDLAGNRRQA